MDCVRQSEREYTWRTLHLLRIASRTSFAMSDQQQNTVNPPVARILGTWSSRKNVTWISGLLYPNSPIRPSFAPHELVAKEALLGRADLLRCRDLP